MQGYYQVTSFHIYPDAEVEDDVAAVDYIVVSRRSRDRAGLRYQRRGVDDDAHVANFVETESVMRVEVRKSAIATYYALSRFPAGRSLKYLQLCPD